MPLKFGILLMQERPVAEVVRRLNAIGFHECIAYAWLDGVVMRSAEDLLDFVVHEIPRARAQLD